MIRKNLNSILNEKIAIQKELDTLNLNAEDKLSEMQELEQNIKTTNEKYAMEKEDIGVDLVNFGKEIEDVERKNQSLKVEAATLKQQSSQRLYKATRRFFNHLLLDSRMV